MAFIYDKLYPLTMLNVPAIRDQPHSSSEVDASYIKLMVDKFRDIFRERMKKLKRMRKEEEKRKMPSIAINVIKAKIKK